MDFGEKEILDWLDNEQRAHHASKGLTLLCVTFTLVSSNSYSILVIRFQSKDESFQKAGSRCSRTMVYADTESQVCRLFYTSCVCVCVCW